ncbi:MAG: FAD-dependent oxidoreductase [Emcibacteraceae bacterium]|nr:FAD-dependent oxidoreductase [Emcibacteraceae bacterium]
MPNIKKKKIAVIGAGISGLSAAWLLSKKHDVTVFEADKHFGGHANTVTALTPDGTIPVDTGFIVCNDRNYPNFLELLEKLKITPHPTEMSFGVSMDKGSFEYAGSSGLKSLLAQRRNIVRPRFWQMVRSIMRFYEESSKINPREAENITLRDYLEQQKYDSTFLRDHILPMAAAVWSTPSSKVGDFPFTSFLRFCQNHGLLQIKDRPQWFTIPGGSREYVSAIIDQTNARFEINAPIESIRRTNDGVLVTAVGRDSEKFDNILIATHANTALEMLKDADPLEKSILSAFKYARNEAILHSDTRFMPKRKRAWSSWNYIQNDSRDEDKLSVTYWMNKLQPLDTKTPLFVTLNPHEEPNSDLVHYKKNYDHPIFDLSTLTAQKQLMDIMGHRNVWYAGAHFGYGFHEDGLQSGLFAAEQLGDVKRPWNVPEMNDRIIALDNNVGENVKLITSDEKAA